MTGEAKGDKRKMGQGRWRGLAAGGLVVLLLCAYTWRTIDRNWDWEDEERLFRAAYKVRQDCPCKLPCWPLQGCALALWLPKHAQWW